MQSEILDPRSRAQAEAKVSAAKSALRAAQERANAAKSDADYAQMDLNRIEKLVKAKVATREALDKARNAAQSSAAAQRSANFTVDVTKYELAAAETTLRYSAANEKIKSSEHVPIRSPITGRVLRVNHECEGVVQTGQPLLEVGDTKRLEIEIDVLSEDAVKIVPGMRVQFTRWGRDTPLEGRVRTVEPVGFTKISALGVEEQRVFVIADFVSAYEEWERLGDGYRVEARFILWHKDNVTQLPSSALFQEQGKWYVFAIVDGKATRTEVKIGERNGFHAQLLDGLKLGDRVIIHPDDRIQPGTRVKSREEV
jgi:HlyD family secretion protein